MFYNFTCYRFTGGVVISSLFILCIVCEDIICSVVEQNTFIFTFTYIYSSFTKINCPFEKKKIIHKKIIHIRFIYVYMFIYQNV